MKKFILFILAAMLTACVHHAQLSPAIDNSVYQGDYISVVKDGAHRRHKWENIYIDKPRHTAEGWSGQLVMTHSGTIDDLWIYTIEPSGYVSVAYAGINRDEIDRVKYRVQQQAKITQVYNESIYNNNYAKNKSNRNFSNVYIYKDPFERDSNGKILSYITFYVAYNNKYVLIFNDNEGGVEAYKILRKDGDIIHCMSENSRNTTSIKIYGNIIKASFYGDNVFTYKKSNTSLKKVLNRIYKYEKINLNKYM